MAFIPESRLRALDANGNAYVGATLTIYDAGTTNLSSIYRDASLSTPMTNPTSGADVADSAGYFPQIFAAEGATFDITLKTSGGVVIKSYVSVPAVGSGTGVITRDFTNSRFRVAGSGGIVRVEAGDPSGDDVGGKLTLGGYLSSQADQIILDGATVNTTGILTENSKKLPGVVQSSGTFSAATSFVVPISVTPSGVTAWDIDFSAVGTVSNATISTTFSLDNGTTYLSAANYTTNNTGGGTSGALYSSAVFTWNTGRPLNARLRFGANTSFPEVFGVISAVGGVASAISNGYSGAASAVTNIKFTLASGTFTGWWRAIPLRATGDA